MNVVLSEKQGYSFTADGPDHEAVVFAREEMRRYLSAILGSENPGGAVTIRLALTDDADLGDDGFETHAEPGKITITGGGPAGLVFGVYDFLRRHGGCRFSGLGPDGEYVPKRAHIDVPSGSVRRRPRLWYRGFQFSSEPDFELARQRMDWMAKNGMNYVMVHPRPDSRTGATITTDPATGERWTASKSDLYDERQVRERFLPEMRKRGLKLDMNHHNLFFWLPPEIYFDAHPEWYALRDGKRTAEFKQLILCTSNPEPIEELIRNMKAFLRRVPETRVIGVIPEDSTGMCQCDCCRAMDLDPADASKPYTHHRTRDSFNASKSRRYAVLLNQVARALRDEFPHVLVGAGVYVDLQWPAPGIKLEKNILPWIATYWQCGAHTLERDTCYMNDMFRRLIEDWRAYHEGPLILYEYYMGMSVQHALPYPMTDVICREWPGLTALGIGGATVQSRSEHHNVYAPNYLAFARCGWDEAVKTSDIMDDFLLGMFGAAGEALRPFYVHLENKTRAVERGEVDCPFLVPITPAIGCLIPNNRNAAYYLDEEGQALLESCLHRAASAAADDRERRQVERFRVAAAYWLMVARMILAGHDIARALEAGERSRAADLAADALRAFEPEADRLEARAEAGWFPADRIRFWRDSGYECGLDWFREIAAEA